MKRKYSSIPFIPLKAKDKNIAIENELILDTDNNKIYIQKENPEDFLTGLEDRLVNDKEESTEYSININMNEPNPSNAITYEEDAEGFIPLSIDKENGNCNYGSWKTILEKFFGIEPVLVNNGEIVAKLDPDNFNKILDEPFTKNAIYGFEYDMTTDTFSYTDDAIPLASVEFDDNKIKYNGWKDVIFNLIGVKPVLYNDIDKEVADIDPFDYSKIASQSNITADDIMIRFKHLYYYMDINKDKITFRIASYKVDETFVDDIFGNDGVFYVSAYNASEDINGNLVSKSGAVSKVEHPEDYYTDDIINKYLYMLFLGMMIGNDPKLYVYGYGESETVTRNNGTMDTMGIFAKDDKSTKTFGAENLFGNRVSFDNALYADGSTITYNATDEEANSDIIKIDRIMMIESNDLAYANTDNMLFCTGSNNMLIYLKVPVRIFK